jgi:NAD-dependent dihydropyrimidine dehydrogenase PreA subunit
MFLRYYRGLFESQNLLSIKDIDNLCEKVQRIKKWETKIGENEGFELHPPYVKMPEAILEYFVTALTNSNFLEIFPKVQIIQRAIIMKYCADQKHELQVHRDMPEDISNPILSVVFTICIENCPGGSIDISNRNDGNIVHSKDSFLYTARHNTAYAMFGSMVTHGVKPLNKGVRYAFVLFFNTLFTEYEVHQLWAIATRDGVLCHICFTECSTEKILKNHIRRKHA